MNILAVLLGFAGGVVGYWFTTFQMQPILDYRQARARVLHDLIYFAQVVNPAGLNDEMSDLHRQRILSLRNRAAEIDSVQLLLPKWYSFWQKVRERDLKKATRGLIGLSNTFEYEKAAIVEEVIRKNLKLPACA